MNKRKSFIEYEIVNENLCIFNIIYKDINELLFNILKCDNKNGFIIEKEKKMDKEILIFIYKYLDEYITIRKDINTIKDKILSSELNDSHEKNYLIQQYNRLFKGRYPELSETKEGYKYLHEGKKKSELLYRAIHFMSYKNIETYLMLIKQLYDIYNKEKGSLE